MRVSCEDAAICTPTSIECTSSTRDGLAFATIAAGAGCLIDWDMIRPNQAKYASLPRRVVPHRVAEHDESKDGLLR
jgi:hypothetical protein